MPSKNINQLEEIENKIKQLEARKKDIQNKLKEKERKERTRRLIQIGAIMDSIGINNIEIAESFKEYIIANKDINDWLKNHLSK